MAITITDKVSDGKFNLAAAPAMGSNAITYSHRSDCRWRCGSGCQVAAQNAAVIALPLLTLGSSTRPITSPRRSLSAGRQTSKALERARLFILSRRHREQQQREVGSLRAPNAESNIQAANDLHCASLF
jgi:hypothetical protein